MEMLFLNPEFDYKAGIGTTVRKGRKWLELGEIGRPLEIKNTANPQITVATGKIIMMKYLPFSELTDDDIRYQHTVETRNKEGLFKALQEAYGPEFSGDDPVTVVKFSVQPMSPTDKEGEVFYGN